jgi:hypothetical protein
MQPVNRSPYSVTNLSSENLLMTRTSRRNRYNNTETRSQATEPSASDPKAKLGACPSQMPRDQCFPIRRRRHQGQRRRRYLQSPSFCLRSPSCFSMSVALAQRIAGKVRNKPAASGPNKWAELLPIDGARSARHIHTIALGPTILREQPTTSSSGTVAWIRKR